MAKAADRRCERPVLTWSVPRHYTWVWWKHAYRNGRLIPLLLFLPWVVIARIIVRPIQYPFGIPLFFGVPTLVVAFVFWQYPDANPGVDFWLHQMLMFGGRLLFPTGGWFVLAALNCAFSLLPGNVSIYRDRVEFSPSADAFAKPRRIMFEGLESTRIIIVDAPDGVEQTLWFISCDVACSVPLSPEVDYEQVTLSLPCPVIVDDRRDPAC